MSTEKYSTNEEIKGGSKDLGLIEKKKEKQKANKLIAEELIEQGHSFQAHQVKGCGKPVFYLNPKTGKKAERHQRCGYRKLCDSCSLVEARKALLRIEAKVEVVRAYDQLAVARLTEMIPGIEERIREFVVKWDNWTESRGKRSQSRRDLSSELIGIGRAVRSLRKMLPTAEVEEWVKMAKENAKKAGPLPADRVVSEMQKVPIWLRDALDLRQEYELQFLTVTLRTGPEQKRDSTHYRRRINALKKAVQRLLKYGALAAPGSGAIMSIHSQASVHAHMLYYGPVIETKRLRSSWAAITETSFKADVRKLLTEPEIKNRIRYLFKLPGLGKVTAEERVRIWFATKGQHQITYSGVFSPPTQKKMKCELSGQMPVEQTDEHKAERVGIIDLLRIDSWHHSNQFLDSNLARRLSLSVHHMIQDNAEAGYAPTEDDLLVLEKLQNIAEEYDVVRSGQQLVALINQLWEKEGHSIRRAG